MANDTSVIYLVFIVFIAATVMGCEGTGSKQGLETTPVQSFEFVIELTESGAHLESHHGTAWKTADFGGPKFYLDRHGIGGRAEDRPADGFSMVVETSPSGATLKSLRGTSWTQLSYSCGTKPCRFVVTEKGVRGLP